MTDLDKRLQEILEEQFNDGHFHCEYEYCDAYAQTDEALAAIHEAYLKAGYLPVNRPAPTGRLTGAEWLDRFERAMKPYSNKAITRNDIWGIARAASGIKEDSQDE